MLASRSICWKCSPDAAHRFMSTNTMRSSLFRRDAPDSSPDEIREAVAGDILVIKAHTPHGFVNIGEQVLKQVDIHHSPRFQQQNLEPTDTSLKAGLPVNRAASESASPR